MDKKLILDETSQKARAAAVFEELILRAENLSNAAAVITTAMFDSRIDAVDCEGAMRLFVDNLSQFSTELEEILSAAI